MPSVTTWRYHVANERGEGWAIAFLDSIGCFSVLSDYGNYGHRWPQNGWGQGDFRSFLLRCGDDYILHKLVRDDVYYGDRTLRAIKDRILEERRQESWDRERARAEWDLLDQYSVDSREEFAIWYQHTRIDEAYELAVHDVPRQAVAFMKHVMPRLRTEIRAEMEREAA